MSAYWRPVPIRGASGGSVSVACSLEEFECSWDHRAIGGVDPLMMRLEHYERPGENPRQLPMLLITLESPPPSVPCCAGQHHDEVDEPPNACPAERDQRFRMPVPIFSK